MTSSSSELPILEPEVDGIGLPLPVAVTSKSVPKSISPPASRNTVGVVILLMCTVLLVQVETLRSMVEIWLRADTYTHGLLIFPISVVLVWWQRTRLESLPWRPSFWGLLTLVALSCLWLLANLTEVQAAQQFFMVAMIPALIWSVLGLRIVLALAFPLGFLIFAVPFGDFLIPHLMEFTAAFTVKALQLSTIPVYREGFYFSIPNGMYEVAEVCSGIRYLIASIALGSLYAYLSYSSTWRRLVFFAVAVIVPVVANGFRAYGIVLIGYFSDMRLGRGVDHLIYGWLFFGVVMFLMFWAGTFLHERKTQRIIPDVELTGDKPAKLPQNRQTGIWISAAVSIAILFFTTLVPGSLTEPRTAFPDASISQLPNAVTGWSGPIVSNSGWRPAFRGADLELDGRYEHEAERVQLVIEHYSNQNQDNELINYENRIYDNKNWLLLKENPYSVVLEDGSRLKVMAAQLHFAGRHKLVWYWYDIAGHQATQGMQAKLLEAWSLLTGHPRASSLVAIATDFDSRPAAANLLLGKFVQGMYPALVHCMGNSPGKNTRCGN